MLKRHHAPVALVVTALGTIVLSIIVSIASGDYYDGLSVPFISYVGRDEPSYYVFAVGMSLSGAGVVVVRLPLLRGPRCDHQRRQRAVARRTQLGTTQ